MFSKRSGLELYENQFEIWNIGQFTVIFGVFGQAIFIIIYNGQG